MQASYIAMRRLLAILIIMGSLVAVSSQENNDDQQGSTEDLMMQEIEEINQAMSSEMSSSGEASVHEFYSKCVLFPVINTFTLKDPANKTCTVDIPMFSCYGYCDTSAEHSDNLEFKMETYTLKIDANCKCCKPVKLFSVYPRSPVICEEGHLWTGKRITFDMPLECRCQSCKPQPGLQQRSTGYHVTQPV